MCNFVDNYYQVGDSCVKNHFDKCIATSDAAECIACLGQNYPNPNNLLSCISVPKKNQDNKCMAYNKHMNCIQCQSSYYLSGSFQCLQHPHPQIVKFCSHYSSVGVCVRCQQNYYLNYDLKMCLPKSDNKCLISKINQCSKCEPSTYYSSLLTSSLFTKEQVFTKFFGLKSYVHNHCISLNSNFVSNCHSYDEHGVCTRCEKGYYQESSHVCNSLSSLASTVCTGTQMPNATNTGCINFPTVG